MPKPVKRIGRTGAATLVAAALLAACAAGSAAGCAAGDEAAGQADFESRLSRLVVRLSVLPPGDDAAVPHVTLRQVVLYVPADLRFEPPAVWPDGSPMAEVARVSEAQAAALLDALSEAGVFDDPPAAERGAREPGLTMALRADAGDSSIRRVAYCEWGADTVSVLTAIRDALEGDAAKPAGTMLDQVSAFLKEAGEGGQLEDAEQ